MNSVLETWGVAYATAVLNVSLVVGDPNHCAHVVSTELYASYSHIYKLSTAVALEIKAQTSKFDLYQNAIAVAVATIVSKIQWTALTSPAGSEDRSKCIKKLLSLLAWQLARFWDVTGKVRVREGGGVAYWIHGGVNARTHVQTAESGVCLLPLHTSHHPPGPPHTLPEPADL